MRARVVILVSRLKSKGGVKPPFNGYRKHFESVGTQVLYICQELDPDLHRVS